MAHLLSQLAVAARTPQLHRPRGPRRSRRPAPMRAGLGVPFPFAHLAVGTLAAVHPRVSQGLGAAAGPWMPASCPRAGAKPGAWAGFGAAWRAPCARGLEVSLLAAVDVDEGGAYPLCARQSPTRRAGARAEVRRGDGGREVGLALLREALAAGARELLGTRWVAVDGGYSSRPFVEGVRELDLHTVGRLRRDFVLRHRYTGPHPCRPGRRRQFDGRFDPDDPTRLTRTTLDKDKVDSVPRRTAQPRPGSAGCRWSMSCPAGPTRRRPGACFCTAATRSIGPGPPLPLLPRSLPD